MARFESCFQIDRSAVALFGNLFHDDYTVEMQRRCWSNLPILNEWKHRYPDQDPVAVSERFSVVRPVCPGGGKYVWNERWQTMESTVYGHPGEPKPGPGLPPLLGSFRDLNFGITFEDDGLRSRVKLRREESKSAAAGAESAR